MATDKLAIYNDTLTRLGQDRLEEGQTNDDSRKLDAIYPQQLEELTSQGPEKGWKFATIITAVDVSSTAITAFADYSGTVDDTTSCTAASHGLVSGERVNITGTTNYNSDFVITVIDANTFHFVKDFVADDATGTVKWTSFQYAYRFAVPANLRVVNTQVGGFELADWKQRGDYILTNLEDTCVDMKYVISITDTTKFPPHFTKVLYLSCARELAYSIIQNATFQEQLIDEIELVALPRAISRDEQGQYVQESSSAWVDVGRTGVVK